MQIGDKVRISDKNLSPHGNGVSAYANMEGIVSNVDENNSFILECGNSVLVVPANNVNKTLRKGIWVYINDELVFHRFKKSASNKVPNSKKKPDYNLIITIIVVVLFIKLLNSLFF